MSHFKIGTVIVTHIRGKLRVGQVRTAPVRDGGEWWYECALLGQVPEYDMTAIEPGNFFSVNFDKHHCVLDFGLNGPIPYDEVLDYIRTRNCGPAIMAERSKTFEK